MLKTFSLFFVLLSLLARLEGKEGALPEITPGLKKENESFDKREQFKIDSSLPEPQKDKKNPAEELNEKREKEKKPSITPELHDKNKKLDSWQEKKNKLITPPGALVPNIKKDIGTILEERSSPLPKGLDPKIVPNIKN